MSDRIFVYDTRTGRKSSQPIPSSWLDLYPHLSPTPSGKARGGLVRTVTEPKPTDPSPNATTVTEPSQARPSAAVPTAITDSGTAAQED